MRFATSQEYLEEIPQMPRTDAQKILKQHSYQWEDFTSDFGDHETYDTAAVLEWMGY